MKITLSAAMRARDVSRPRPEQLAEAAEREQPMADGADAPGATAPGVSPPAEEPAQPRARRRRRRLR